MSQVSSGTLAGLDLPGKGEELANLQATEKSDTDKKPVRRSNSFSRRKKKSTEAEGTEPAAAGEEAVTAQKPTFKVEAQADPLRESLQAEAIELFQAGDYDQAGEKWYFLAEAARHAGNTTEEAQAMQNMGTSLVNLGELHQAFACYDRALQLAEQAKDQRAQIDSLLSLKWLFHEVGAISNAVRCLEEVVEHLKVVEPAALHSVYLELGQYHALQEEWAMAEERLKTALELARVARPDSLGLHATILLELANAALYVSDDADATAAAYEEASEAADKAEEYDLRMRARHDFAMTMLHTFGNDAKGQTLLEEMSALAREAADKATTEENKAHAMEMEGRACIELGPLVLASGDKEGATTLAARGIELATELEIDEALGVCHTQMGDCLIATGKHAEAVPQLHAARGKWRKLAAEHIAEWDPRHARDCRELQELYDNSARDTFIKLAAAILGSAGPQAETEALLAVEEGRGAAHSESLALGAPPDGAEDVPAVLPTPSSPFDEVQLRQLLSSLYGEAAPRSAGAIVYWAIGPRLGNAEPPPTAERPADEPEQTLWAWVITADGVVTLCRSTTHVEGRPIQGLMWDLIEKLRLFAQPMSKRGDELDEEQVEKLTERFVSCEDKTDVSAELALLAKALLEPLMDALPPGAPLTLIPDDMLNLVPFSSLPLPTGEPLITAHAISQVSSLKVLAQLAKREAAAAAAPESGSLVLTSPATSENDHFPEMPACAAEGEAVASMLSTAPENAMSGSVATLPGLCEALKDPLGTVHISAYMRNTWVVLAPPPKSDIQEVNEDGSPVEAQPADDSLEERVLHAGTVQQLLWMGSHPVVVLGGSHGGAGRLSKDGVLGLPRAFLTAGARSVLATLIDAVDEPTALLLKEFHRHRGKGQSAALREAILTVRSAEDGKWKHPLFWAGFVLTGSATTAATAEPVD